MNLNDIHRSILNLVDSWLIKRFRQKILYNLYRHTWLTDFCCTKTLWQRVLKCTPEVQKSSPLKKNGCLEDFHPASYWVSVYNFSGALTVKLREGMRYGWCRCPSSTAACCQWKFWNLAVNGHLGTMPWRIGAHPTKNIIWVVATQIFFYVHHEIWVNDPIWRA